VLYPQPVLALLNQSEYLPNQLLHGSIGLLVFLVLSSLRFKQREYWAKYLRVAAFFHLALFFGVLVFKLSSWPPLVNALLTAYPWLERFHPFEPTAHMIEELATMGGYSYLAAIYLRREYPSVMEKRWLHYVLGTAFEVYAICWILSLAIALSAPFPMTGLYTDLNAWSVLYRAFILVPGIVYCALFTYVFIDAAFERSARSAVRLTLLAIGTTSWSLVCAEQLAWAAVHALANDGLRDLLALPHVTAESLLYGLWGATWIGAFVISCTSSQAEETMQDYIKYLRIMRYLKSITQHARTLIPDWRSVSEDIRHACSQYDIHSDELQASIALAKVVAHERLYPSRLPELIEMLHSLRSSLAKNLDPNSTEMHTLLNDPYARSLNDAAALLSKHPPSHFASRPRWAQIAIQMLSHHGYLKPGFGDIV
jgi:hypothetical protein